jgi:hypothetical protein
VSRIRGGLCQVFLKIKPVILDLQDAFQASPAGLATAEVVEGAPEKTFSSARGRARATRSSRLRLRFIHVGVKRRPGDPERCTNLFHRVLSLIEVYREDLLVRS